jgi:hypothetical protein
MRGTPLQMTQRHGYYWLKGEGQADRKAAGPETKMIPMTEAELNEVVSRDAPLASELEVRTAIQSAYPFENGQMVVKHVRTAAHTSWYRVNWYCSNESGLYIARSRFLIIRSTPDGLHVEDQTLTPPPKRFSVN